MEPRTEVQGLIAPHEHLEVLLSVNTAFSAPHLAVGSPLLSTIFFPFFFMLHFSSVRPASVTCF